jgi:putative flippase GtrA
VEPRRAGLATLGRHQLAGLAATVVDYGSFVVLVELVHLWPEVATAIGAAAGGVTNFTLSRHVVFRGSGGAASGQAMRYALVWLGSLLLNTLGVFLLYRLAHLDPLVSRLGTAVAVSLGWNFPLHRNFVFPRQPEATTKTPLT